MKRLTMRCGDGRRLVLSRALPDREAKCLGLIVGLSIRNGVLPSFGLLAQRMGDILETEWALANLQRAGLVYLRLGGDPVLTGVAWHVEESA